MLLIGYSFGIRSERRLCEEVHLNLAYRWSCRLGLEGWSIRPPSRASGSFSRGRSLRRWAAVELAEFESRFDDDRSTHCRPTPSVGMSCARIARCSSLNAQVIC